MPSIFKKQTPYALICKNCGQVFLTAKEYERQLMQPNRLWECPMCREAAAFDDKNMEKHLDE